MGPRNGISTGKMGINEIMRECCRDFFPENCPEKYDFFGVPINVNIYILIYCAVRDCCLEATVMRIHVMNRVRPLTDPKPNDQSLYARQLFSLIVYTRYIMMH